MGNPFVHVELNTTDLKKAEAFYSHLFEWKMEPMPMGNDSYTLIKVGDGVGGGNDEASGPRSALLVACLRSG